MDAAVDEVVGGREASHAGSDDDDVRHLPSSDSLLDLLIVNVDRWFYHILPV